VVAGDGAADPEAGPVQAEAGGSATLLTR